MDNQNVKQITSFMSQKKEAIIATTNNAYTFLTGNKFILWWGYLGLAYFITYKGILPLGHSYFLIANGTNLLVFYLIIGLIAFLISQIINILLKILLYLFK